MLEDYTLVAVETAHIQSYIFASNRLKENVGASYLVAAATGEWAYECVEEMETTHHNIVRNEKSKGKAAIDPGKHIEDGNSLDAEVLYSGGGNFVVLFRNQGNAKDFVRRLSRRVMVEAPGLALTFVENRSFNWENDSLGVAVSDLLQDLSAARSEQPLRRGLGGLGVTMMCSSSSLPATHFELDLDGEWQVYSSEVKAKQNYADKANEHLRGLLELDKLQFKDFTLTSEIDELGRSKGDTSYIAVVHADGNELGLLIKGLKDKFTKNEQNSKPQTKLNRDYVNYMRSFSENVKEVNRLAQQKMFQQIADSIEYNRNGQLVIRGLNEQEIVLTKEMEKGEPTGKYIFPIRPLVSGGDDVTFVCDGRIGLDLAVTFLNAFEMYTKAELKAELSEINLEKLTACAGVAIVKTHYPFARAYALADELAGSAKKLVNQDKHNHELANIRYSAIDWHFTSGGIYDELDEMRKREYFLEQGWLTLRPLFIQRQGHEFHNWEIVRGITTEFQTKWPDNRSKAKRLMEALRQGEVEVEVFNLRYLDSGLSLPAVADFDKGFGWKNGQCGYYDALELMDLYVPLREG
jgi:hypothetical protein